MSLSLRLTPRVKALVAHDAVLFATAFWGAANLGHGTPTKEAVLAAALVALKVVLRQVIPVPAVEKAVEKEIDAVVSPAAAAPVAAATEAPKP